jgi:hypothetical protein
MKYLFLFEVNPSPKVCGIIPMKIALFFIALISVIYGIISFSGVIQLGQYNNDAYYYFIQACSFLSPLIIIYTIFKKDDVILYIAIYFHTIYIWVISIVLVFSVILIAAIVSDRDLKNTLFMLCLIQFIYNLFAIYANYIFVSFYHHYDDLVSDGSSNQVSDIQPTVTTNSNYQQV